MRAFFGNPISRRMSHTPEGFLICRDVPICRTGYQPYKGNEVGLDSDEIVDVYRAPAEVLSNRTVASAEGKVLTDEHPSSFVTPFNASMYSRGHIQNVRRGKQLPDGEWPLVADLVVVDKGLIDKIENGTVREISCGYDCRYVRNSKGQLEQRQIRINHVAVVPTGRAGSNIRILDGGKMPKNEDEDYDLNKDLKRVLALLEKFVAMQVAEQEDTSALITENAAVDPEVAANDRLLAMLREMRPSIEQRGDRQQIDSYNNAVKVLKAYNRALKQYPPSNDPMLAAMDAQLRRRIRAEAMPDNSFGETARLHHRKSAEEGRRAVEEARTLGSRNRTTDAPEDWATSMNSAGRKMRDK